MGRGQGGGGGRSRIAGGGNRNKVAGGGDQLLRELTADETLALEAYGSLFLSRPLNRILRMELPEAELQNMKAVRLLDSGLTALPNSAGTHYRVLEFRNQHARERFLKQFTKDGEVSFPEYLSTSRVRNAERFSYNDHKGSTDVRIKIQGKTGKDITKFTLYGEAQAEVLYARNTKFKVVSMKTNNKASNKSVEIVLKEI